MGPLPAAPGPGRRPAFRFPLTLEDVRWPLLSLAVGIVAGFGAILFDESLKFTSQWFIATPTGYSEPVAGALPSQIVDILSPYRWLLLIIPALGGLLSGVIVFLVAPEAEGHGTDAMIDAFHQKGGLIRKRVPFVKIIASAITIGSGGSAGKEGPIAQIGAGFGSFLASVLKLSARDRRILVLAGAAGGIGAIFHAPLGAALFGPEVLYRKTELEYEAILPCVVSAITAYAIFSQVYGQFALFLPIHVDFALPHELIPYSLFGILCAAVGWVYVKFFYGMRDFFFRRLPVPKILRPAVGGLMLGGIIFFFPQVMSGGYGWVQMAMEGKIFWGLMLWLAFCKIAATTCTISSGGSGGVFGPSVFIGAMLGGAFGYFGHQIAPEWVVHPGSYVLVGIGGFFAGVAKVPLAAIIMACEMSASYNLLVPLMLVSTVSYLLLGKVSLYEKQVPTRVASPAHLGEFTRAILERAHVHQAVQIRPVTTVPAALPFDELVQIMTRAPDTYFPVINAQGKLSGIVSINDVREFLFEHDMAALVRAQDVATTPVVVASWHETLQQVLDKMAELVVDELPVVKDEAPDEIVTMISKREIISFYYARSLE